VNHVELVQGVDAPDQYNTRAYFEVSLLYAWMSGLSCGSDHLCLTLAACLWRSICAAIRNHAGTSQVVEGEHTGMKCVQTAIGKYGISSDKPNRQDVTFTGIRIEADPSTDKQQWLGAMKDANPNMVSTLHSTRPGC